MRPAPFAHEAELANRDLTAVWVATLPIRLHQPPPPNTTNDETAPRGAQEKQILRRREPRVQAVMQILIEIILNPSWRV